MKKIRTIAGDTIYDIAIREYGSLMGAYDILERNPSLSQSSTIPANTEVEVSGQRLEQPEYNPETTTEGQGRNYIVHSLNGQTIYDLALQEYGSLTGAMKIIKDNPGIEQEKGLVPGTEVRIRQAVERAVVYTYLRTRGIRPVSGAEYEEVVQVGDALEFTILATEVDSDQATFTTYVPVDDSRIQNSPGFLDACIAGMENLTVWDMTKTNEFPRHVHVEVDLSAGQVWFRFENLSSTVDNVFYFFPDPAMASDYAVTDAKGRNAAFQDYELVLSFENDPSTESAVDWTGNDNHADLIGSALKTTGNIGSSWQLNADSYLRVPSLDLINVNLYSYYKITEKFVWYKTTKSDAHYGIATRGAYDELIGLSTGKVRYRSTNSGTAVKDVTNSGTYNDGNWHCTVAIRLIDSNFHLKLKTDKSQFVTYDRVVGNQNVDAFYAIGGRTDSAGNYRSNSGIEGNISLMMERTQSLSSENNVDLMYDNQKFPGTFLSNIQEVTF